MLTSQQNYKKNKQQFPINQIVQINAIPKTLKKMPNNPIKIYIVQKFCTKKTEVILY